MSVRLSPNFTLEEMTFSQYATRKGFDMTPTPLALANLRRLCEDVLQPIRNNLMIPIMVTSGYRPPAVNAAVGGAANSAHLTGCAADVVAPAIPLEDFSARVRHLVPRLPIAKVIVEFNRWLHIQVEEDERTLPRRQVLVASIVSGRPVYAPWRDV